MTLRARFRFTWLLLALAAALFALLSSAPAANERGPTPSLEFLGQAIVPTGTTFEGTQVGGLSGIAYDAEGNVFYSLSDDPSQFNPARFYTLRVDVSDGRLDPGDVDFLDVNTLKDLTVSRSRRSVSTRRGSPSPRTARSSSRRRASRTV